MLRESFDATLELLRDEGVQMADDGRTRFRHHGEQPVVELADGIVEVPELVDLRHLARPLRHRIGVGIERLQQRMCLQ